MAGELGQYAGASVVIDVSDGLGPDEAALLAVLL